ncbi:MAG: DUF3493 domain-containing protein [Pseudanabaenaceae cyanobacterium]
MTDAGDRDFQARLRAEARAPYRPLRKFIYATLVGSGAIGAVVFLSQLLAGKGDRGELAVNLAIQGGAILLFGWLFMIDRSNTKK